MTITAVGTNTITISQAATATATGAALTAATSNFTTYDTLTSLNISGMINAVINGGDVAKESAIRQISDPRLEVTGGNMATMGGRTYLVFGQDFQGGYSLTAGSPTSFTQIYSDEIRSFKIIDNGKSIGHHVTTRRSAIPPTSAGATATWVAVVVTNGQSGLDLLRRRLHRRGRPMTRLSGPNPDRLERQGPRSIPITSSSSTSTPRRISRCSTGTRRRWTPSSSGGISLYDYSNGQLTHSRRPKAARAGSMT